MANIHAFRAIHPPPDLALRVIAPPYDVLDEAEVRALAVDPTSFVHVTRAEVDVPGAGPHDEAAYAKARENLDAMLADGTLIEDETPSLWLYGHTWRGRTQLGVVAGCEVAAYVNGDIRRHEHTRPDKEDDRARHMEVLDAQVGLVFLAYRADEGVRAITRAIAAGPPAWRVETSDGVVHAVWRVPDAQIEPLRAAFRAVPRLYVADGHHRSAAAARLHARRGDAASATFLAGLYPDDELQILAYNRVVDDLNGRDAEGLLAAIRAAFDVTPGPAIPPGRGTFTMRLAGQWWLLTPRPGLFDAADPIARLDVSVLQDHLLGPLLGIDDPRRSPRIRFVGGIRGPEALERAVDGRDAVAFHLHPTGLDQLFDVADAGCVMPPKSTWFEPKLREGVLLRRLR